jgi:hypothetical protein
MERSSDQKLEAAVRFFKGLAETEKNAELRAHYHHLYEMAEAMQETARAHEFLKLQMEELTHRVGGLFPPASRWTR